MSGTPARPRLPPPTLPAPVEAALADAWKMVPPLSAGPPGSYDRGFDNGLVTALQQVRTNLEAEYRRAVSETGERE